MAAAAILGVGVGVVLVILGLSTPARARPVRRSRLRALLDRAGVSRGTPASLLLACVGSGAVAAVVGLAVTGVPIVALLAALLIGALPIALLRRRATRRVRQLRECWPDAVDTLTSAVRAGMSLPEAVADLATRGPVPLRPAFVEFAADYRARGSFTTALDTLQSALRDPVADRVIVSLRIAREVGGRDLGRVLTTISEFLREDSRTRGEIEARQSWTVNAARVAVAAPWITLLLLCTRPEAVAAYSTGLGAIVIVTAALLSVLAYRVMIAVGRLPDDPRVLRESGPVGPTPQFEGAAS